MSDDILQGAFTFMRHGQTRTQTMGADTAAWILRNDAGVTIHGPDPDFVSKQGTKLWWNPRTQSWWSYFDESPDNPARRAER